MAQERTYQYDTLRLRLYPTERQKELFEKTFGCCRYIWNRMLADQQKFYLETDAHFIPTPAKYKGEAPFLKEVDNQALIQENVRLTQAFRNFFKNPEHFQPPKFKRKKDGRNSYTVCNHVFASGPTVYLTADGIRLTKAGVVPARIHRRPESGWELRRASIQKTPAGKYYCYVVYRHPVKTPEPVVPTEETTVGLKLSARHFYVTDQGLRADPPRWVQQSANRLNSMQKRLARMEPGSRNYQDQVQRLRRLHEHIAKQRIDYLHQESRRITNAWDAVCVRDDDLTALNRLTHQTNLTDSSFGTFLQLLDYKLQRQGKSLLRVDRYEPTTRRCHCCGAIRQAAEPATRWCCPDCGALLDREENAAINIKRSGLELVPSIVQPFGR